MVSAIPSEKPNRHWNKDRSTEPIQRILQNEKHMGDVLFQKNYTADFIVERIKKNNGELP